MHALHMHRRLALHMHALPTVALHCLHGLQTLHCTCFDLQPLLHSTSCRSRRPLQSLNLQPTTLDLQPDACLKPLLTLLGPPLDQQPLQPLLAFLGPTLNQQPLPPPTQLWLQSWRR